MSVFYITLALGKLYGVILYFKLRGVYSQDWLGVASINVRKILKYCGARVATQKFYKIKNLKASGGAV